MLCEILTRGLFGAANGISGGLVNLLNKRWLLFGFGLALITAASICFGVFNPLGDARVEELAIGLCIGFIPIMSARRKV